MKNIAFLFLFIFIALAQDSNPVFSENALKDKPGSITQSQQDKYEKDIAPYIQKALSTYPQAKKRFLNGLPEGESFFITTRIYDPDGKFEQIFLYVEKIDTINITGQIFSQINPVKNYYFRQRITISEDKILDWLITKPDGKEEGNFIGKFLDTYQP